MTNPTDATLEFVSGLNEKFKDREVNGKPIAEFMAEEWIAVGGRKYDKVFHHRVTVRDGVEQNGISSDSIYCFIERETGGVFKAAGLNAPASGVRYNDIHKALENADPHGGFLYR